LNLANKTSIKPWWRLLWSWWGSSSPSSFESWTPAATDLRGRKWEDTKSGCIPIGFKESLGLWPTVRPSVLFGGNGKAYFHISHLKWMTDWMNEWMDGWMNEWMDEWNDLERGLHTY
jgi:hypothetical protein